MTPRVLTIGVYGFDEESFFNALKEAGVDTFCDIRARRGMRGGQYSFVNSKYLQSKIRELDINYYHLRNLAPSDSLRNLQKKQDKESKVSKRTRTKLSAQFIDTYEKEVLEDLDVKRFLSQFEPQPEALVLFCVEREPEACHRSIVAKKLAEQLQLQVKDILP